MPRHAPKILFAVGAVAIVGAAFALNGPSTSTAATATNPTANAARATTKIVRRDLVDTTTVNGTLSYGTAHALRLGSGSGSTTSTKTSTTNVPSAAGSGAGAGGGATTPGTTPVTTTTTTTTPQIITSLPVIGAVFDRGATLFEVNGAPGPALLFGPRPMWRALKSGITDGFDVQQFELNLVALGITDNGALVADNTFTSATTAAIKQWQTARGVTVNGTIEIADIVYEHAPIRVASVTAIVGDQASGSPLTVTGTTQLVHVSLDPANSSYVTVKGRVSLTLPDSSTTTGIFDSLSTVATVVQSGNSTSTTVSLTISIPKPPTSLLDGSPITVNLVTSRAHNVLAVPVASLLALAEGGYALEKVNGDSTQLVKATTGKFADGFVEVKGDFAAGDTVVTA